MSDGLFRVFKHARQVSGMGARVFDIGFGSVGYLYEFQKKRQPSWEQLEQGLEHSNYRDIVFGERDRKRTGCYSAASREVIGTLPTPGFRV